MNETVKAALLAERREALQSLDYCASSVANAHRRLQQAEKDRASALDRVEDLEAFLRDNGVDLAAVDAEAEKARPFGSNPDAQNAIDFNVRSGRMLGSRNGDVSNQYAGSLNAMQQDHVMAGLAKALDNA